MKKRGIWWCILLMLTLGVLPGKAFAEEVQTVDIPVRILVEGAVPGRETDYTVELRAKTHGAPMPDNCVDETWQMTLKAGGTGYICIPCDRLGVFDYTIRQIPGTAEDCTYDTVQYRLRVMVTMKEDGEKTAAALLFGQEDEKVMLAAFRNRWAQPDYLTISAWKTMDGNTPEDGAFRFRLLSEDGEVVYEVKNDGRRVRFPELRFDREGTFRYFLKEVAGGNRKVLYDRSVYTITVTVTRDTDYHADAVYERNGKPWSGTPSFANYTDTGSPKTGDTIVVWFGLLGASAAAMAVLLWCRKKQ